MHGVLVVRDVSSTVRSSGLTQWWSVVRRTHWPLDARDTLPEFTTSNVASVLAVWSVRLGPLSVATT